VGCTAALLYFMCSVMGRRVLVPPPTWLNWKPSARRGVPSPGGGGQHAVCLQHRAAIAGQLWNHRVGGWPACVAPAGP
jgi:hypothetical protein